MSFVNCPLLGMHD